ncbi:MAG: Flp family type IVb pilin [Bryobacteraceae bacterium]
MSFLKNFFAEEDGQDMVEYGLILALVVAGGVAIFQTLGAGIVAGLNGVTAAINAAL